MNVLCLKNEKEIKEYTNKIIEHSINYKGFAIGTGNSITDYIPVKSYLAMIDAVREYRGE